MKVAALTGGRDVPSARFRVRQLIPDLRKEAVYVTELVPTHGRYPPPGGVGRRLLWGVSALAERVPYVAHTHHYDITLLQRELLSTFVTLEPFTKRPRVLDVDDAIFLRRQGKAAEGLARMSDLVICGNDFLAEHFIKWNRKVVVIPTAVDTERFSPIESSSDIVDRPIIGWIGTSGNFKYLYQIEKALENVMRKCNGMILRVIADKRPRFKGRLNDRLEFIQWSPDIEASGVKTMSIGIMPLGDGDWERGKCAYKMLQYMSCGVPVVASPVGMNAEVLSLGTVGFSANSYNEWIESLEQLLMNESLRDHMGKIGRDVVKRFFSLEVVAESLAENLMRFK
jgi:glycosyltransferase involved in cell wall biosynthesis